MKFQIIVVIILGIIVFSIGIFLGSVSQNSVERFLNTNGQSLCAPEDRILASALKSLFVFAKPNSVIVSGKVALVIDGQKVVIAENANSLDLYVTENTVIHKGAEETGVAGPGINQKTKVKLSDISIGSYIEARIKITENGQLEAQSIIIQ